MTPRKSLLLITLSFCFSLSISAQNFDINLVKSITRVQNDFKDDYFKFTSQSVTYVNIAAPLGVLTAGVIKHDKKLQRDAVFMIGGFLTSSIITQGLKRIVKRDRPYITYPFVDKKDAGGGYSFPSGHTSASFCTATSLSLLFLNGFSRIYLGVHYPTDVLAGAVIGAGSAWLSYKAEKWYTKKYNKNKQTATAFAL